MRSASDDVADLCFTARALAQTHPLTEEAHRYRQRCFEAERVRQPVTELADWAATALLVGYCLRRAEERRAGRGGGLSGSVGSDGSACTADLSAAAADISNSLRAGNAEEVTLLASQLTISALDRVIATELDKRREHLREQLDDQQWSELQEYIAWWVVHGYSTRAAETLAAHSSAP